MQEKAEWPLGLALKTGSKVQASHPLPEGPTQAPRRMTESSGHMRDIPLALQRGKRDTKNQIQPAERLSPKFSEVQPLCFMSNAQDFRPAERSKHKSPNYGCATTPCLTNVLVPSTSLSDAKRQSRHVPVIHKAATISSLKPPAAPAPLAVLNNQEHENRPPIPFSPKFRNCFNETEAYESQASPTPHGPRTPSTRQGSEISWTDSEKPECTSIMSGDTDCDIDTPPASIRRFELSFSLRAWATVVEHSAWRRSRIRIAAYRSRLHLLRATVSKFAQYAEIQRNRLRWTVRGINKYALLLTRRSFTMWADSLHNVAVAECAGRGSTAESSELQALVHRHITLATSQEAVICNLRERLSCADVEYFKAIAQKQEEIGRLQTFAATDAQQLKRLQRKMVEDSSTIRDLRKQLQETRQENKRLEAETSSSCGSGGDCEQDLIGRCEALRASLQALSGAATSRDR